MTSISIRIYGPEAAGLLDALEAHPALSKNLAGRLAIWLGLRVLAEQPEWVDHGLREMKAAAKRWKAASPSAAKVQPATAEAEGQND